MQSMSTEEKCVISTFRPSGRHQPNFPMPAPTQMAAVAKVRSLLCERNTQEGSPWNTFTESELAELRRNLPDLPHPVVAARERRGAEPSSSSSFPPESSSAATNGDRVNILDPGWADDPKTGAEAEEGCSDGDGTAAFATAIPTPAPKHQPFANPTDFRHRARTGAYDQPTNGVCPGFMQCNLVVLPHGKAAFDFLLFCQRNKKSCPLIEVCDIGSPHPHGAAKGADLRTDVPRYSIYRDGVLAEEVTDATEHWPEDSVAFLIGCSFSYDGALTDAGIPLRSVEQGRNIPMYRTNLKCRPAGDLKGNMVVSMKPVSALRVAEEVEITARYPHAHGAPVCVGSPESLGIEDLGAPDWGDPVDMVPGEVPVFHACGVTPQSVLMDSKVPFAITHSAGYMFVTDLPSDTVV